MKHKPGKGRRPRRQQKVFKMKNGGPKFWRAGGRLFPSFASIFETPQDTEQAPTIKEKVASILQTMGLRSQNR